MLLSILPSLVGKSFSGFGGDNTEDESSDLHACLAGKQKRLAGRRAGMNASLGVVNW